MKLCFYYLEPFNFILENTHNLPCNINGWLSNLEYDLHWCYLPNLLALTYVSMITILPAASVSPLISGNFALLYELISWYNYAMHMREQYILQPTESSPGTRNPGSQRQRMAAWSVDTQIAGSMYDNNKYSETQCE